MRFGFIKSITTKYIYARVSSTKQRDDLKRQIECLKKAYPGYDVISDIGSGINFKRKGLCTLLDKVIDGMVKEVVVMYRDRLARFGIDLLEFFFKKKGVKFVVHSRDEETIDDTQQLAEDLMAITTVFVAAHHGKRARKGRKGKGEENGKEEEKDSKIKSKENLSFTKNEKDQSVSKKGREGYIETVVWNN